MTGIEGGMDNSSYQNSLGPVGFHSRQASGKNNCQTEVIHQYRCAKLSKKGGKSKKCILRLTSQFKGTVSRKSL
jgi:hypothetical protein